MAERIEEFHLGDLLTVMTGRLLTPSGLPGVDHIVTYVTRQPHLTHQIPRALEEIKPFVLEQHPWLAEIADPGDRLNTKAEVTAWLDKLVDERGEFHDLARMPEGQYVGREPLAELREMAPDVPIIVVEARLEGRAT